MPRRIVIVLVVVAALGALLWWIQSPSPPPPPLDAFPRGEIHEPRVPPKGQGGRPGLMPIVDAPPPPPPSLPPPTARPVIQTELIRASEPSIDAGLKPRRAAGRTFPTDRRGDAGPRAAQQLEMLSYAFETLDDDVQECLEQWKALEPNRQAQVMIAFELDQGGLTKSWVENDGEVPFGPRSCFANAVFGIDWSHIVDQPAKVTKRFELGVDGGSSAP